MISHKLKMLNYNFSKSLGFVKYKLIKSSKNFDILCKVHNQIDTNLLFEIKLVIQPIEEGRFKQ